MERKRNFSHKRQAILETIRGTKSHPSAEWVMGELEKRYPNLSLATVYRNIARFKEDGEIMSVGVVDGHERFDGIAVPHPHFICTSCGAVIDVDIEASGDSLSDEVSNRYGVTTEHYDFTFYGKCTNCLNKN
ncbi:MAG: transcriptional repressor [Clostridia bacterium]